VHRLLVGLMNVESRGLCADGKCQNSDSMVSGTDMLVSGFPMETVSHVLYWCLSHEQELEPKEQLCYLWLLKFLEANESVFAFDVP
jgi:hypothetical protein